MRLLLANPHTTQAKARIAGAICLEMQAEAAPVDAAINVTIDDPGLAPALAHRIAREE